MDQKKLSTHLVAARVVSYCASMPAMTMAALTSETEFPADLEEDFRVVIAPCNQVKWVIAPSKSCALMDSNVHIRLYEVV